MVGSPKSISKAIFKIKLASEILDMSCHTGTHPRLGATDVCPFIPISGVTDEDMLKSQNKLLKGLVKN